MSYVIIGFVFGMLIPYMERRFAKFMPATAAYALYRLIRPVKQVSSARKRANSAYQKLLSSYVLRCLIYGCVTAGLSYLAIWIWGEAHIFWYLIFVWTLLLLTEIDYKIFYLPDILTFPFLLIGFLFAVFVGAWAGPAESAVGAVFGYFMPVLASLFVVWKHKDAFGGGDIKLLSAIGAWLGVEPLLYVILLSCIIFGVYALIFKKRVGAFGPAIASAAILIAFSFDIMVDFSNQ